MKELPLFWFPRTSVGTGFDPLQRVVVQKHGHLHSHAGSLIVIHKSSQTRKAVISAWMPKSGPWMVTSRLYKCSFQSNLPARSFMSVDIWTSVVAPCCHPWTLDFGIHAEMTGLQHLSTRMSAGAWERWQ